MLPDFLNRENCCVARFLNRNYCGVARFLNRENCGVARFLNRENCGVARFSVVPETRTCQLMDWHSCSCLPCFCIFSCSSLHPVDCGLVLWWLGLEVMEPGVNIWVVITKTTNIGSYTNSCIGLMKITNIDFVYKYFVLSLWTVYAIKVHVIFVHKWHITHLWCIKNQNGKFYALYYHWTHFKF